MNFTHLMPDEKQPSQELLQKFSNFLLIVVLSDEMRTFALDAVKFDMESSDDVLCQLVLPEHLDLAQPGSLLGSLKRQLDANRRIPNTNHSFIAASTRAELTSHPATGGEYYPLMLNTLLDNHQKVEHLKACIHEAIHRSSTISTSEKIVTTLKAFGPAASLVAGIYRVSHGIP